MTNNQIQYAMHLENVKHNRAQEATESRKAGASEVSARASASQAATAAKRLGEDSRHNLQSEAINWFTARSSDATNRQQATAATMRGQASLESSRAALEQSRVAAMNAQTKLAELAEAARHAGKTEELQKLELALDAIKQASSMAGDLAGILGGLLS